MGFGFDLVHGRGPAKVSGHSLDWVAKFDCGAQICKIDLGPSPAIIDIKKLCHARSTQRGRRGCCTARNFELPIHLPLCNDF